MADVTVVFTHDQAELVQVLLNDPHLYAYDDATKEAAKGARGAVQAGLNAYEDEGWEDDDRRSCGCPSDYHMSDCPLVTVSYPDEGSWEEEEGRGFEGYGEDD